MSGSEDIHVHVVEGYRKRESKGSISPDLGQISALWFYGSRGYEDTNGINHSKSCRFTSAGREYEKGP